ncbi:unnamed protein product [Bathycoccus prasinos]
MFWGLALKAYDKHEMILRFTSLRIVSIRMNWFILILTLAGQDLRSLWAENLKAFENHFLIGSDGLIEEVITKVEGLGAFMEIEAMECADYPDQNSLKEQCSSFYDALKKIQGRLGAGQVHIPAQSCSFYLLDSEVSRSTQPFVDIYNEKKRDADFNSRILKPLKESSNRAIEGFLHGDSNFLSNIELLSKLQFEGFKEMILPAFVPLWEKGLSTGDFYLKLCGAGSGGYYLAIGSEQHILDNFKGTALKLF